MNTRSTMIDLIKFSKSDTGKIWRWIFFLPIACIVSRIIGEAILITEKIQRYFTNDYSEIVYGISGVIAGTAFVIVSWILIPQYKKTIVTILCILSFVLSMLVINHLMLYELNINVLVAGDILAFIVKIIVMIKLSRM